MRSLCAFWGFRQRAFEDRGRHAGAHFVIVAREGEQWCAGPEDVGGGGVRVALGRVEEEVADAGAGNVLVLLGYVGEEDAVRHCWPGPHPRCLFEIGFSEVGKAKQPQDCLRQALEDAQPGAKGGWFDLGVVSIGQMKM